MQMRWAGTLAVLVLMALPALAQPGIQPAKWQVVSVLEGGSSHTCGDTMVSKFYVEFRSDVLRFKSSSGTPTDLKLLGALNADGSGKVRALNPKNREVTLDFDAGQGPRTIRYSPPYSVCVWSLIPTNTPAKSAPNRI